VQLSVCQEGLCSVEVVKHFDQSEPMSQRSGRSEKFLQSFDGETSCKPTAWKTELDWWNDIKMDVM
jgi:hypothetical protein